MTDYAETDRLLLRQFTAHDADLLIELDSDPAVMRYLTGGEPDLTPDAVRDEVIPSLLNAYERWDSRFGLFAAHEKETGDFIGWFLLRPLRTGPLDEVEVGYRLRQDAWGKGYATEGSRALVDKGFAELGVTMVWGETMASNVSSQKVMSKLGMSVVAQIPTPEDMQGVEGAERGGYRFEITKEQWDRR
ncbi:MULTISPECIES: GNAT family N-acetyltransferase [unclassified Phycicoccus]|uniref:GNAT family N-acetyltransferase n=1 Tax=unclassified Phycicoccus TaxID=2637926 RepID=UPI000702D4BB|nr:MULTISPECIES: GNAT family N-acetyltransferase [unclassified Phycicoccus]KQU66516.1 GCN5 family acetyltransferase [Phycicoccus sp. Root101]KQZ87667.1 GCN5 family acetyltransferase [Phycicoccus sp. Root563]